MSAGGIQPAGVKNRKRSLTRKRPLSDCRRQVCVKTQFSVCDGAAWQTGAELAFLEWPVRPLSCFCHFFF